LIGIKVGLKLVKKVVSLKLSFLFVSMNKIFAPYIARYALLCGEPYNIYFWVSGSLSNFRYVYS
jgi:ribosomal protein S2